MKEDVKKHLEFVQGAINRMSANSFLLKGWSVTLSAALVAVAANNPTRPYGLVALFPALAFWGLDAFYLRQERLFRALYDDLRKVEEDDLDKVEPFSMATEKYKDSVDSWWQTFVSSSVVTLHGMVTATVLMVTWMLITFR